MCKVLEHLIKNHIIEYLEQNGLISDKQFGFVRGRSTGLQLMEVTNKWTEALDNNHQVDIIYMDIMKAFDTVPHNRLIGKLKSLGIKNKMLAWIQDFLSNRFQTVLVGGKKSQAHPVISGIPQGSVLGPLLFIAYNNDLAEDLSSEAYLFADDTKLFKTIQKESDSQVLQEDLDKLVEWTNTWLLKLHPDKCKQMSLARKFETQYSLNYTADDKSYKLELSNVEKDLGVFIDSNLDFEQHIYQKIKTANKVFAMIRRAYLSLNEENFLPLYKVLVRSHLDYAVPVWSPHKEKYKDALESVQRNATRQIPELNKLSYPERLERLKLPTLAYRRVRSDMIECYKILHQVYNTDAEKFFKLDAKNHDKPQTRGHHLKLYYKRSNKNIGKYSFANRVTEIWNSLPLIVVDAPNTDTFKRRLDKYWSNQELLYNYKSTIQINSSMLDKPINMLNIDLTIEATDGALSAQSLLSEEDIR